MYIYIYIYTYIYTHIYIYVYMCIDTKVYIWRVIMLFVAKPIGGCKIFSDYIYIYTRRQALEHRYTYEICMYVSSILLFGTQTLLLPW